MPTAQAPVPAADQGIRLSELALERPARIVGFQRLDEGQKARLCAAGLRPGAAITKILRTPLKDPVECLVGPQLLALEGWLLERILVQA